MRPDAFVTHRYAILVAAGLLSAAPALAEAGPIRLNLNEHFEWSERLSPTEHLTGGDRDGQLAPAGVDWRGHGTVAFGDLVIMHMLAGHGDARDLKVKGPSGVKVTGPSSTKPPVRVPEPSSLLLASLGAGLVAALGMCLPRAARAAD